MKKSKIIKNKTVEMMLTMFGAIAGVGFVAGVEIEDFFARFGWNFLFGIIVLFFLMFVLVYRILSVDNIMKNNLKMQKIDIIFNKNTLLIKNKIKKLILFFNLLMIASAMLSGLRVLLFDLLGNKYYMFYLFSILVLFFMLVYGIKGLAKFNYIVIVFLVFLLIFIIKDLAAGCDFCGESLGLKKGLASITFACIYVFMNIVEIEPIVKEYGMKFNYKKRALFSLIFAGIVSLFVFLMCLFLQNNKDISTSEMPLLAYFGKFGSGFKFVFCVGLVIALLSTLLTCLVGVKRNILNAIVNVGNLTSSFFAIIMVQIVGILPFSFFTKIIYPIIGILNFIIFVFL